MGLLTWKEFKKGGKIQLSDTKIAKNYMTHEELSELTSLVNLCLDSATLTVKRGRPIYMNEWVEQVNAQLKIHGYEILSARAQCQENRQKESCQRYMKSSGLFKMPDINRTLINW